MDPITPDASVGAFSCLRVRLIGRGKHAVSHVKKSINQPTNQPINQTSNSYSANQPTNPSIKRSITPSIFYQSINQPLHQSTNLNLRPINPSTTPSINQPRNRSCSRLTRTRGSSSGSGEGGFNGCSRLSTQKPSTDTNIRRASMRTGSVKRPHAMTSEAIYVQNSTPGSHAMVRSHDKSYAALIAPF